MSIDVDRMPEPQPSTIYVVGGPVEIVYHGYRAFACMTEQASAPFLAVRVLDADFFLYNPQRAEPANADAIYLAERAIRRGYDVVVPTPDYTGVEYDFTEDEFRALIARLAPTSCDEHGWPDMSDIGRVLFPRARSYMKEWECEEHESTERYALVRLNDETVAMITEFYYSCSTSVPSAHVKGLPPEWSAALEENEARIDRKRTEMLEHERKELEEMLRAAGPLK